MKMRGFKRVSPSVQPVMNLTTSTRQNAGSQLKQKQSVLPATSPMPPSTSPSSPGPQPVTESPNNSIRGKYCHYFVNSGRCDLRKKLEKNKKFEHQQAPMCNFGINCPRPKCMFSHQNINGNRHFLGNMRSMNNLMPWQMINPWLPAPPYQLQSNYQDHIWNIGKQNNQVSR